MRITLRRSHPFGYIIAAENGADILVQSDWDYPSTAGTFGWSLRSVREPSAAECEHDGTDGTIPCDGCGLMPADFIGAAADWLDSHDGATADDPGYF